jgi:hypothetical protein
MAFEKEDQDFDLSDSDHYLEENLRYNSQDSDDTYENKCYRRSKLARMHQLTQQSQKRQTYYYSSSIEDEDEEEEEKKNVIIDTQETQQQHINPPPIVNTISQPLSSNDVPLSSYECINEANKITKGREEYKWKPVYNMSVDYIAKYLSCRILYQDYAMDDIATTIDNAIQSVFIDDQQDNKPFVVLLTGESGIGKTQSVKEAMYLLNMGEGQPNSKAFISYRFGRIVHASDVNFLTGASPGYTGYGQTECLYDKLVEASKHYEKIEQPIGDDGNVKPHLILLFFDELDKADKNVMKTLNSLLSDGSFIGPTGKNYTIPRTTRLLVFFTANFGDKELLSRNATMENDYFRAPSWIELELEALEYRECDISRMGKIIPFFVPPQKEILVILVRRFYSNLLKKDAFALKFGSASITDEILYQFIISMSEKHPNSRGIKKICEALDSAMTSMSTRSFRHFDNEMKKIKNTNIQPGLPLNPPANFVYEKVPYNENLSKELGSDPLLSIFIDDRFSLKVIKTCLKEKNAIELFGLNHPTIERPSFSILAPIVQNNVNIFCFNDPSLVSRYEKLLGEQYETKMLVNNIKTVIDSDSDIKIETKNLITKLISTNNPLTTTTTTTTTAIDNKPLQLRSNNVTNNDNDNNEMIIQSKDDNTHFENSDIHYSSNEEEEEDSKNVAYDRLSSLKRKNESIEQSANKKIKNSNELSNLVTKSGGNYLTNSHRRLGEEDQYMCPDCSKWKITSQFTVNSGNKSYTYLARCNSCRSKMYKKQL